MRMLFVYQDFAVPARDLLTRLSVEDVDLVIVRKGEVQPPPEILDRLRDDVRCAICQVHRKYKKNVGQFATIEYEAKHFRTEDVQLQAWLLPIPPDQNEILRPSLEFERVSAQCADLVIAPGALAHIDDLDTHRWHFVKKSAALLLKHAQGHDTGPMRNWLRRHGVDFAVNGQVSFTCNLPDGRRPRTEWHLKEGDRTSRTSAARIYFNSITHRDRHLVVVLYAGPHPRDGNHDVALEL